LAKELDRRTAAAWQSWGTAGNRWNHIRITRIAGALPATRIVLAAAQHFPGTGWRTRFILFILSI
jgi:hypothetical protein